MAISNGRAGGASSSPTNTGSSSVTPTIPTGTLGGDAMLMFVLDTSNRTITVPSGWAHTTSSPYTLATGVHLNVLYKVAGGTFGSATTDTTPTVTFSGASLCNSFILSWSGVDTSGVKLSSCGLAFSSSSDGSGTTVNMAVNGFSVVGTAMVFWAGFILNGTFGISMPSTAWTDPNSQLGGTLAARISTNAGATSSTNLPGMSLAEAQPASPHSPFPSVPAVATFSTSVNQTWHYSARLTPLPDAAVVTGAMGHISGSAAIAITDAAAITGALGHISGTSAITVKDALAVVGAMGKIAGSAAVSVVPENDVAIAGSLGAISGSITVEIDNTIVITGALGAIAGASDVTEFNTLAVTGSLGSISGAADVVTGAGLSIDGALGSVGGSASVEIDNTLAVSGALGALSGSGAVTIQTANELALAGSLGRLSGAAEVILGSEIEIVGAFGRIAGQKPPLQVPTDPLVVIIGLGYDRVIQGAGVDRVIATAAIDRTIVQAAIGRVISQPAVDRMIIQPAINRTAIGD